MAQFSQPQGARAPIDPTDSPAGWYPDPARAHEARYFDGHGWTEHVADAGEASQAPLGPPPAGLLEWLPPHVANANAQPPLAEVPRVKMWVLAVLSLFVFWFDTPSSRLVLPIGVLFAISCWRTTSEALASHIHAGSPKASDIKAARWVAVAFAAVSVLQCVLWSR